MISEDDLLCPHCNLPHRRDHNPADLLPCGGFSWELWMGRLRVLHRAYWAAKATKAIDAMAEMRR